MGSSLALALAGWLVPASIHIVQWPASGPVRLALLSPTWQLAVWMAGGAAVAAGALVWSARIDGGARKLARVAAPFLLLWAWAIPYLPWIPDRLPLLLVLAGPLRWVIAVAALAHALSRVRLTSWSAFVPRIDRRTVFALSLVIYSGFGVYSARQIGVGGDEPHYLIITESLLRDGDLKIENNHRRRDYLPFFQGDLRPDYFERGSNGEIYSIHAPGLPALVLPAYALAGRIGVVVFIALLAALTALAVFDLALEVGGRTAAVAAWVACCLTVPFVPYAWLIFPEMPGALLVAWAALWTATSIERTPKAWGLRGLALSVLPWLHTKFVILLVVLVAGLAFRLRRRLKLLAAFATPVGISVSCWLYSFYAIYGVFDPEAPYGTYPSVYVLTKYIPHGLLGLFFDQKFGLLPYSPIYLFALAGAWLMLARRETRFLAGVLLATIAAFVGTTARLYMFWGGASAPARFLVPLLPCLAPMVALGIVSAHGAVWRGLAALWLAVSLVLAAAGMGWPARLILFSVDHGKARILEMIQGGSPLSLVIPTFTDPDWAAHVPVFLLWAVVSAVALGVAALAARLGHGSAWTAVGSACAAFLLGGSVVSAHPDTDVRAETARRGALDVLWRFDGNRFRTLDYERLGRATPERFIALTTVSVTASSDRTAQTSVSRAVSLPPGAYDALVSFDEPGPRSAEIRVLEADRTLVGALSGMLSSPARVAFDIPVAARRLSVTIAALEGAANVSRVEIVPRAVIPPGERERRPVRFVEAIPGRPGAFLGYTDEHAYPENGVFWSRGTARTEVIVAPSGARRMALVLSTGPMSGRVFLSVSGERRSVEMVGGQQATLFFDLPPAERLVPVSIESTVMFRPAEREPSSTDQRGLGCQVRITLE
jgi:hypothetical protein